MVLALIPENEPMMDNLIERLRERSHRVLTRDALDVAAADEIERLRTYKSRLRKIVGQAIQTEFQLRAEIERLRAERDEWKAKWIALAQAAIIVGGSDEQSV